MKRSILLSLITLCIILVAQREAKANYAAGGELIFVHIGDSTYQFFFKLYRDCAGDPEPDSVALCFHNTCTNSTFSRFMDKWTGTQLPAIVPICATMKSNCDSIASPIPGYKEIWYWETVTMPSRCNSWRIFTYSTTRNNIYNISNALSTNMYVEARMNNAFTDSNSSPYYSVRPLYGVAQSSPFTYNAGAVDTDGDSLSHDLIMLRSGVSTCSDTASNMSFATASPAYNLVTNPIGTNNTFGLNAGTGQMGFTPTTSGKANIVLRTREYRNGVMMGYIMREMQIMTLNLSGSAPAYTAIRRCGAPATGIIHGCEGTPMSFCIDFLSSDAASRLFLVTNLATNIPGASIVFSNLGNDSVRGTFTWTPTANDVGNHVFATGMVDSLCSVGVALTKVFLTNLTVWGKTTAGPDTAICAGQTTQLHVSGGGGYQWSVVSGTPSSLSNPNSANPVASPTTTTIYEVASTNNTACPHLTKDTVTVTVVPVTNPSVTITISPDSNIAPGTTVAFTATKSDCATPTYQWKINGNNVPGATSAIFTSSTLNDNDKVTCEMVCGDPCPSPQTTTGNIITIHVTGSVGKLGGGAEVEVYPNPNKGEFTLKNAPEGSRIIICNLYGQELFNGRATTSETKILVRELPDGIYLVKFHSPTETKTLRINIIN